MSTVLDGSGAQQAPLELWLKRLRASELPVFGNVVVELNGLLRSDRSSVAELARVILQDAGMTAKVLKLSNSVWFNPTRQSVSTVSRAIMLLGSNLVAQIALSLGLIDKLLSGPRRMRVARIMACSFHAAVQARALALRIGDPTPEEVFVAALLAQLGDMAFWCICGETGDELEAAMQRPGVSEEDAQDEVLGFRLRQLSGALSAEWKLGPFARNVAEGIAPSGSREQLPLLSLRLARAVEGGWECPAAAAAIDDIARHLTEPADQLIPVLGANASDAAGVARVYGAAEAAKLIPMPHALIAPRPAANAPDMDAPIEAGAAPDPQLQLRILRDISAMIASRPNVTDLLQMVLEGIYRGAGMDRALVALLNPQRTQLAARVCLGTDGAQMTERFNFNVATLDPLLTSVLRGQYSGLLDPISQPDIDPKLWTRSTALRALCATDAFLIAPIFAQQRVIGLYYADRKPSGRVLVQDDCEAFMHFVQQANLGFELAAGRRPAAAA